MKAGMKRHRGLALVAVILLVAAMVVIATTVTVMLASHATSSARFAQEVRARGLAEAGIERALVVPDALIDEKFDLESGSCSVKTTAVEGQSGRRRIVSSGELRLGRGVLRCRVELVVEGRDASVRIVSRSEQTRYLPKVQPSNKAAKSAT